MRYKPSGRIKAEPVQPPCKKTIYHSQEEAQDMIRHISETRIGKEIHTYKCPVCGFWHLTSKNIK